jgi:hypothetical protein
VRGNALYLTGVADKALQARLHLSTFIECVKLACIMAFWKYEALLVGSVIALTAILSGGDMVDWLGATAVFFTFMHGQVSFDFQEAQQVMEKPHVPCYRWSGRYFVIKEILWVLTFSILQAWPLLLGTLIFASYPYWRKKFRKLNVGRPPAHLTTNKPCPFLSLILWGIAFENVASSPPLSGKSGPLLLSCRYARNFYNWRHNRQKVMRADFPAYAVGALYHEQAELITVG